MIHIICPNNNIPERSYAIDSLICDVLGFSRDEIDLSFSEEASSYEIFSEAENNKVIIEDHFFNLYPEPLSYFCLDNIPTSLHFFHGLNMELPIIYGRDYYFKSDNTVVIGLDVFASTFFMLSRWEEFLLGRETDGDCDESRLFAVVNGIYMRPLVNEYASLLLMLLPKSFHVPERHYQVILSHDVDGFRTPSWMTIAKDFFKQILHGYPNNRILNLTWKDEIKYRQVFPTSYRQFEMYKSLADKYNVSEWFYFKVCGKGETEATYFYDETITQDIVSWLRKHGDNTCVLGFHPSQNVFRNKEQWNREVSRIRQLLCERPTIGRNHHLLYNHESLRLWEQVCSNPLSISNCVFHGRHGFRSGVCSPYHLFDIHQRRVMNLIEHPCQVMDTVIRYDKKNKSREERWRDIQDVVQQVKKYKGELVLTWHIYIRNKRLILEYFDWCDKVLDYAVCK